MHTKTAFSVKGVCKRFSDFKELDGKIKRNFKNFTAPFPPDKVFNSMEPEFVSERRKQLQKYLDEVMTVPEIASYSELHNFLGIPDYNEEVRREQEAEAAKRRTRVARPDEDRPDTYLKGIEKAKLDGDRIAEAQAFNALGLLYCETGLEAQGVECMENALELCRAESHRDGMVVVLSNLGCIHNMLDAQGAAVEYFQSCFELLEGNPIGQAEAQMKLSLTCVDTAVCTCVEYLRIHTYTHKSMHTHTHARKHSVTCTQTGGHAWLSMCICVCMCACVRVNFKHLLGCLLHCCNAQKHEFPGNMPQNEPSHPPTHTHMYIYIYIHIYIHTYIHAHIYYACVCIRRHKST